MCHGKTYSNYIDNSGAGISCRTFLLQRHPFISSINACCVHCPRSIECLKKPVCKYRTAADLAQLTDTMLLRIRYRLFNSPTTLAYIPTCRLQWSVNDQWTIKDGG